MERLAGFSTGVLHRFDLSLEQKIDLIHAVGSTAVELNLGHGRLARTEPTPALQESLERFSFVTIHAPALGGPDADEHVRRLARPCRKLPVDHVVFHPDGVEDLGALERRDVPLVMENMDKDKETGLFPDEFRAYNQEHGFGYVLDAQHVYEHDPGMALGEQFLEVMGERLRYAHVSGETRTSNHAPLRTSDNAEVILGFVARIDVPVILEGVFSSEEGLREAMCEELALVQPIPAR